MGPVAVTPGSRVYLDTAPIIYIIEQVTPYAAVLSRLWQDANDGRCELVTSQISILEVRVKPERTGLTELLHAYDRLFCRSALRSVPIDEPLLRAAAVLRAQTPSLRTPDAIHIATAHAVGATHFVTNDRRLRQLPGLQVEYLDDLL